MKIQAFRPSRAAWAATALARLPVEEHETVSKPKSRAWRQRDGDDTIFEAQRRKADGIVLDVEIRRGSGSAQASPPGAEPEQRREAYRQPRVKPWGRGNSSE